MNEDFNEVPTIDNSPATKPKKQKKVHPKMAGIVAIVFFALAIIPLSCLLDMRLGVFRGNLFAIIKGLLALAQIGIWFVGVIVVAVTFVAWGVSRGEIPINTSLFHVQFITDDGFNPKFILAIAIIIAVICGICALISFVNGAKQLKVSRSVFSVTSFSMSAVIFAASILTIALSFLL